LKIHIFTLAKELKIDSKVLIALCHEIGIAVKNSSLASVSEEERDRILAYMKQPANSAVVAPRNPAALAPTCELLKSTPRPTLQLPKLAPPPPRQAPRLPQFPKLAAPPPSPKAAATTPRAEAPANTSATTAPIGSPACATVVPVEQDTPIQKTGMCQQGGSEPSAAPNGSEQLAAKSQSSNNEIRAEGGALVLGEQIAIHSLITKGLLIARDGIAPFVLERLQGGYGATWWKQGVKPNLTVEVDEFDGEPIGTDEERFARLDVLALLKVMKGARKGKQIFSTLGHDGYRFIDDVWDIRKRWAHQQPITYADAIRGVDAMSRLLRRVGADVQEKRLRSIWSELTSSLAGQLQANALSSEL
jgi:hypothetical protein